MSTNKISKVLGRYFCIVLLSNSKDGRTNQHCRWGTNQSRKD